MKYLLILSTLLFMPLAQAADTGPEGTRVSLSSEASQSVINDELVVHYRIAERGGHAKTLQKKVNRAASEIENVLKSAKVKHKTTSRRLSPVSSDGVFTTREWEMVQSGEITTGDLDGVTSWLGEIEAKGAKLNHLQFRISEASRKTIEEKLKLEAIAQFREKAATIAKGLSAKSFRVIQLNTGGGAPVMAYAKRERSYSLPSAMSDSPQLTAGESRIQVTVSGSIEVPFKSFPVR